MNEIYTLHLCSDLMYLSTTEIDPFTVPLKDEKVLVCAIYEEYSGVVEPDKNNYIRQILQIGEPALVPVISSNHNIIKIPAGTYLFMQTTEPQSIEIVIEMAIEIQKEGLWRNLNLENFFFVRMFMEDERIVTQVLRPILQ